MVILSHIIGANRDVRPDETRLNYITPCWFVPNATESQSSTVLKHLKSYYEPFPLWVSRKILLFNSDRDIITLSSIRPS